MKITDSDFKAWDPRQYLVEYFPPNVDAEPIVRFCVEESYKLPPNAKVIDVGCGPTACYWLAVAPRTQQLFLSDYLESNLVEQKKWVNQTADCYDWSSYTQLILQYEGLKDVSLDMVAEREELSRRKISGYYACDVNERNPLGEPHQFDVVISLCVADSITNRKAVWERYMHNIFSLIRPGGLFIGAAMRNCTHYDIEQIQYPAANVNEDDFRRLMLDYGFEPDSLRIKVDQESHPIDHQKQKTQLRSEYDEIVLASGVLASRKK